MNKLSQKLALLIGVSEYGEGMATLSAPRNDVAAMKRVLEDREMGNFDQVQMLFDPSYTEMTDGIRELFESSSKRDLILLYFSGHGVTDDEHHLYLATRTTTKKNYVAHGVPANFIQKMSKNGNYAKRQVIILDCCYSGAFARGWTNKGIGIDLKKELGAEGRVVLTASAETKESFEHENSSLSLYTQYLIEGIETGAADQDGDGKIHIRELYEYTKNKVQEVKPTMEPEIIFYKDNEEAYDILISKAPINDAEQKFRQEVEKRTKDGKLSERARDILQVRQINLQLSEQKAQEIIDSVLADYRVERNLKKYEEEYRKEVLQKYPLDEDTINELREWQDALGLQGQDVEKIEQRIISEIKQKVQELSPKLSTPELETQPISVPAQPRIILEEEVCDLGDMSLGDNDDTLGDALGDMSLGDNDDTLGDALGDMSLGDNDDTLGDALGDMLLGDDDTLGDLADRALDIDDDDLGDMGLGDVLDDDDLGDMALGDLSYDDDDDHITLESEVGINYTSLRDLLAAGKWKEADGKTYRLVIKAANREEEGYLYSDDWLNFPCKDLRTIDQLWVQYSNSRFGFSIQKQIWESLEGNPDADWKRDKLYEVVGWRKKGELAWLSYNELTYNPDKAPPGHLPALGGGRFVAWCSVFSRAKTCNL
jgi:hypothetical protein